MVTAPTLISDTLTFENFNQVPSFISAGSAGGLNAGMTWTQETAPYSAPLTIPLPVFTYHPMVPY